MISEPDNSEVLHRSLWWWTNCKDGGPPELPSDLPDDLFLMLIEVTPPYPARGCLMGGSQTYDWQLTRRAAGFETRDLAVQALQLAEAKVRGDAR